MHNFPSNHPWHNPQQGQLNGWPGLSSPGPFGGGSLVEVTSAINRLAAALEKYNETKG